MKNLERKVRTIRAILAEEFDRRKKQETKFTRKEFAKEMGISPGTMSGLLSGAHGISVKRASEILERLKICERESREILLHVASQFSRSAKTKINAKWALDRAEEKSDYELISEDKFSRMMEWYHIAILELCKTRPFRSDPAYIARRLSITKEQASEAIRRLKKLKLIKVRKLQVEPTNMNHEVLARTSSEAMRRFHQQVVDKAKESLENDDYLSREITSVMLPINPDDLPRIRPLVRDFWQKIAREFEVKDPKELYALNVHFFPLSVKDHNKEG